MRWNGSSTERNCEYGRVALDDDGCGDASQVALFLELVDHHRRAVGQLVAGEAKQLLADQLAGEEALAAVGERLFVVEPALLRQVRFDDGEQALDIGVL